MAKDKEVEITIDEEEIAEENGQKVTIDGKEYEVEHLSDAAKTQIINLRIADQEITSIQQKLAIAQTARNTYGKALEEELPKND